MHVGKLSNILIFNCTSISIANSPAKIRRMKFGIVPSKNLPVRSLEKALLTPTKEKILKRTERLNQRRQNKLHGTILFEND